MVHVADVAATSQQVFITTLFTTARLSESSEKAQTPSYQFSIEWSRLYSDFGQLVQIAGIRTEEWGMCIIVDPRERRSRVDLFMNPGVVAMKLTWLATEMTFVRKLCVAYSDIGLLFE